jgi:hypothetical protein
MTATNPDMASLLGSMAEQDGDHGRLAAAVLRLGVLLLNKNRDYGGSAWRVPVLTPGLSAGEAILVRMSDKVERIRALQKRDGGVPLVSNETFDDTVRDLAGYCLLYLARPGGGS